MCNHRGKWPGLDLGGQTLAVIRQRIRGKEGGDDKPPPSGKHPESIGAIIERMRNRGEVSTKD
jgi:hypothetical protein